MDYFKIRDELTSFEKFSMNYIEFGVGTNEHCHEGFELVYVVAGHGKQFVNHEIFPSTRGTLLVMDRDCIHKLHVWETLRYYTVMFDASFLSKYLDGNTGLKEIMGKCYDFEFSDKCMCAQLANERDINEMEKLFFSMLCECMSDKPRSQEMTKCFLNQILNLLIRNYEVSSNITNDVFLSRVIDYISEYSYKNIQLEEVEEKFNYKSGYLSKRMKEEYGAGFKQILVSKRLSDVIYALLNTEEVIDDIIAECGFSNKTYFYKLFKQTFGVKPKFVREYRNNFSTYIKLKVKYNEKLE